MITAVLYGRASQTATVTAMSELAARIELSMLTGDMFLPAALTISSFVRSMIVMWPLPTGELYRKSKWWPFSLQLEL